MNDSIREAETTILKVSAGRFIPGRLPWIGTKKDSLTENTKYNKSSQVNSLPGTWTGENVARDIG